MAKTERAKFDELVMQYEIILHPNIFNPIRAQVDKVYEEAREKAFVDAKITPEAREIEKELNSLRERIKSHIANPDHDPSTVWWYKKLFIKYLIKKLDEPNE